MSKPKKPQKEDNIILVMMKWTCEHCYNFQADQIVKKPITHMCVLSHFSPCSLIIRHTVIKSELLEKKKICDHVKQILMSISNNVPTFLHIDLSKHVQK